MKKQLFILFLAGFLVVTVASVFPRGEGETPAAEKVPAEEKVPISILIWRNGDSNFPDDTEIGKIIEEKLNINYKPILVMSADLAQKISTMIASGDVPDMMPVTQIELYDFAESNIIIPLDDLLKKYAPNILKKYSDESFATLRIDGKRYAVPASMRWSQVPMIRKDWLDRLGIDLSYFDNATLEDFRTVLKRFKEEDPDGNGKADTIPFAAYGDVWQFDFIWAAFGYRISEFYEKDGMVLRGATFPELKEAIEYLRRLYAEELLDPEFAITTGKMVRSKYSSGTVGFYYHNWALAQKIHPVNKQLWAKVPDALFVAIPPPIGPTGKRGCMKQSPTALMARTVIMKASEHPDRAMQYLDFICSDEGWMLTKFGVEGIHYKFVDGIPQYIIDADERINKGVGAYQVQTINPNPEHSGRDPIGQAALDLGYKYGNYGIQLLETAPSSKEYDASLNEIVAEHYLKMIVEYDKDLDQMFDKFVKSYMEEGGSILGKERYEIYKAQ